MTSICTVDKVKGDYYVYSMGSSYYLIVNHLRISLSVNELIFIVRITFINAYLCYDRENIPH